MKNVKHMILAGAIASVFTSSVMAAEVGPITTFQSGQAAQASQVNANFQALITAINDNNSRIAALEAALASANSVAGKYYKVRDMGWILAAHRVGEGTDMPGGDQQVTNGFSRVGFYSGNLDFHFAENGEITISGIDMDVEMFTNPNSDIGSVVSGPFNETGTWVQDGHTVTVTLGEGDEQDVFEFTVSRNGEVLSTSNIGLRGITPAMGGNFQHEYEGGLGVGVRVDPPAN